MLTADGGFDPSRKYSAPPLTPFATSMASPGVTRKLEGSVDFIGHEQQRCTPEEGASILARRSTRKDLAPNQRLPADTRLWAALQLASGGAWAGCVYDPERIVARLTGTAVVAR